MQSTKMAKKSLRPQSQRLVLEPRIVFDAVLPVMGAEVIDHFADHITAETTPTVEAPAVADSHVNENHQTEQIASDRALIEGTLAPTNLAAKEIIFIDAIVADLQQYITSHPNADVVLLDANRDGVEQIAAVLAGRTGIESVHIISHGSAGNISLGNASLNLTGVQGQYADELATIKAALSENADILIYGCNVAEGQAGQAFAIALATSTGADIAASTDLTGAIKLGGDWNFETQTGFIDSLNVINAIGQTDFNQLLGPAPISLNFGTPTVLVDATGGLVGDKWLYANVTPGVDAVVTISAVTGSPTLGNIDAPSGSGGRDAAFQPVITSIPSANERITFTINFVLTGTATTSNPTGTATTLSNFIATGVDVDGAGNATEFASYQLPDSSKIEVGSQVTQGGTATNPTFTGISSSLPGIGLETTEANYSVFYDKPVSSITFSLGNTGTSGGAFGPRQNSISFDSNDIKAYNSPVAVGDSATTNEDAPITFSILDNDWGGEQGPDGGRAQTPLNQASVDLDLTTAGIQTTRTIAGQGTFTYNGNGTVTFAPVANFNGVVTPIQYVVSNTVVAGLNPVAETANAASIRVTVNSVDDAPVNAVPGTQNTTEDTSFIFSTANGNAITVSDVEGGSQTVTLTAANGLISLGGVAGLTNVVGNGTGTITFTGSIANINTALNGLSFTPRADYNNTISPASPASITIKTTNALEAVTNFINGGFEQIANVPPPTTFLITDENNLPGWDTSATDNQVEVWRSGFNGGSGAPVPAFEGNYFAEINANQAATLFNTFTPIAGSTVSVDFAHRGRNGVDVMQVQAIDLGADGVLGGSGANADTVLFTQNYSDGNTAWGAYSANITNNASGNKIQFGFTAVSAVGGAGSGNFVDGIVIKQAAPAMDTDTILINVTPVKDTVTDNLTTPENTPIIFNVLTGANGASADNFEGAPIVSSITQPAAGTGSVTFNTNGSMTYTPPNADFNGLVTFTYTVTSPAGVFETETVNITVTGVNDAPVNNMPVAQSTPEDTAKVFSTANGNAIQISDVDAGSGIMTVTLWTENGLITLAQTTGLTFSVDDINNIAGTLDTIASTGSNEATMRFTGTIANINAALNGLSFAPTANNNGAGKITIRTEDNGNSPSTNLIDTDSVVIDFTPVKDTVLDSAVTNEDSPVVISPLTNDSFGAGNAFLTAVTSPANGTAVINPGTGTTTYTPNGNFNGTDSYTYTSTTIDPGFNYEYFTANQPNGNSYANTFPGGFPTGTANATGWTAAITGNDGVRIQEHLNDKDNDLTARWSGVVLIEQAGSYTFNLFADNAARLFIDGVAVVSASYDVAAGVNATITLTAGVHTFQLEYADVDDPQDVGLKYSGLDTGGTSVNVNTNKHWGAAARTETETINITVNPGIDPPAGTDKTITINEDTPYTVTAGDFGFTDPNDSPANTFTNVIIGNTLPPASEGVYKLNGINVTANQVISVADINAGKLTFSPATNVNTTGAVTLGALSFQVQDNGGGAASTPSNTDQSANVLNFKVTPVNDVVTYGSLTDNSANVPNTDAQVFEKDLSFGSTPSGTGEVVNGSFTLGPITSLTSFTMGGGAAITAAQLQASGTTPITRTGSFGTLVINGYNAATSVVSYTYTLTAAANHSAGIVNDVFGIATTDVEGDVNNTNSLRINIVDDNPIAANDVDNTVNTSGNPSSIAYGNVINASNTGAGGLTDPNNQDGVADTIGADINANPVTGVKAGTSPGAPVGGVGGAGVTGTHGILVLNSNGSYSYTPTTLNNPATLTDTFTYQITDGDGDTATATITISIVPSPSITGLGDGAVAGTDGSVLESNLAAGTSSAGTGETLVGSFNLFTGAATLNVANALTVGGTNISLAQLTAASTTNITVTGTSFGTLTITNYDAATGVVTYSYTLSGAQTHGTPQESLNLVVRDNLGNSGAGTLRIDIQDDAPIASADTNSVTETGTAAGTSPIAGNVFTNDQIGADGASTAPVGPVTGVKAGTGTPTSTGINTGVVGAYGTLTLQANGSYSYALDNANTVVNGLKAGQTLTDTYTYKITDKDGDETSTTLTITINGANDAPVAVNNTYNMTEDALPLTLNPLAGDSDPDGDTLRVSNIAGTAITAGTAYTISVTNGTVNVSAGGVITFTPAPNFNGTVTFAYTVSDPSGATSTANQIINIAPVNDAPSPSPDINSTNEEVPLVVNAAAGLLANDTDIDTGNNTGLTVTQFTIAGVPGTFTAGTTANIPNVGTLLINANGGYTFTPAANFNGAVPVATYTVSDNGSPAALTATSTLSLTVNPLNDAPTAVNDSKTSPEDTTLNVNAATGLLANDIDIDTGNNTGLTVTQFSLNGTTFFAAGSTQTIIGIGDITINSDGSYTFVPVTNFNGVVPSITYRISDNDPTTPLTATAQLNITITPVNDAPVAVDDGTVAIPLPIVEDTPTVLNLLGNDTDPDGDTLSVKSINGTLLTPGTAQTIVVPNGTVNVSALGVITFSPASNYNGPVTFNYVVQDGKGGEDTGAVNLNVTPVNDAPIDGNETNIVTEDTTLTVLDGAPGDLLNNATDVDGDPLTITGYTIAGITGTQAVGAPVVIAGVGTITINANGSYSFAPALNFTGAIPVITYTVSDGSLADTSTLSLTMLAVNDPPVATPTTSTGNEDTPIPVNLAGTDVDGTVVSVTVPVLPSAAQGILYLADGTTPVEADTPLTPAQAAGLIFKPAPNFNGTVTVPFRVTDNTGAVSTPANAVITINPVNDAPVAISGSSNVAEDATATISLLGTDIDDVPANLTVRILSIPAGTVLRDSSNVIVNVGDNITIAQATGMTFTPVIDALGGLYNITFEVRDDDGLVSNVGNYLVDERDLNTAPVATSINRTGIEDTPLNIALPGTDVDGVITKVTVNSLPPANEGILYKANGTPVVAGVPLTPTEAANLKFVPAPNFTGAVTPFNFTVTDDDNELSNVATVAITIGAVNDAPDALPDTNSVPEDTTATGNVLTNDTDAENDTLSVVQFTIPGVGTFAAGSTATIANVGTLQVDANGNYTFVPVLNFNGTVPVATYTVTDGSLTSSSTLSIIVTPVNDPPIATSGNATGNEDTPVNVGLTATDVDGTVASISVATLPNPAQGVLYYADGVTPVLTTTPLTPVQAANLKFVPATNFNGTVTIPFNATDNSGATSVAPGVFTININPINDLPTATPTTATTPEDTPVNVGLVGIDVEDPSTALITKVTTLPPASQGILYLADGTTPMLAGVSLTNAQAAGLIFKPATNFNGSVTIPFTVTDTNGGVSTSASAVITITPVNDNPVAVTDNYSMNEDGAAITLVPLTADSDVDGNPLTVSNINGTNIVAGTAYPSIAVTGGVVSVSAGGIITFTPTTNFNGTVTFPYTISDGQGGTASANQVITVNTVNDPPVATPYAVTAAEDAVSVNVSLVGTDVEDGAPNIVKVTTLPPTSQGILYLADGTTPVVAGAPLTSAQAAGLIFKPALNFNGIVTVPFTVTDSNGATSAPANAVITITDVNDPPVATSASRNTLEDAPVPVNLAATDVDGTVVGITVTQLPAANEGILYFAGGTVPVIAGVEMTPAQAAGLVFIPVLNYNSTAVDLVDIRFTARDDDNGVSQPASFIIDVAGLNDDPIATPSSANTPEDTPVVLTFTGTDVEDGVATSVSFVTLPPASQGVLTLTDGTPVVPGVDYPPGSFIFTPAPNYNGPVNPILFTVKDAVGQISSPPSSVTVTITSVNDAPVPTPDTNTVPEDTVATGNLLTNDTDSDSPTLSVTQFVVNGTTVTVTPATPGSTTITGVGTITISSNGAYTFTPVADFNGTVPQVTYTVSDGSGTPTATATSTLDITVTPVNDPPVATPITATGNEDATSIPVSLLGTDVDNLATDLTTTVTSLPPATQGVLTLADGTPVVAGQPLTAAQAAGLIFVPAPNFSGTVNIPFTVKDPSGLVSPSANATIIVNAVNDPPVANNGTFAGLEDAPLPFVLTGSDIEGPVVSYNVTSLPDPIIQGTVYLADGVTPVTTTTPLTPAQAASLVFVPVNNFFGSASLNFTVTDNQGAVSPEATITLQVSDVIQPPVATPVNVSGTSDKPIPISLGGTDADGFVASVTVQSLPPASQGVLTLADGTPVVAGVQLTPAQAAGLIFKPATGFNGTVQIPFFLTDDEGNNSTVAFATIKIADTDGLFEQLLSPPIKINDLDPNRPDPFAFRSPVIPIGMPEDLFVIHSVRESAMRIAQNSNFGVFNVDAPTRGELDNLTYDLKGLPVGMDPTLFVQHAVRSLPITQEPRLFVQNAVRQSQLESTMRNVGVGSYNTATSGISSLFSPFDLGSPNDVADLAVDGVNGEFGNKTAEITIKPATELALDSTTETVVDADKLALEKLEASKQIEVNEAHAKLMQANMPLATKKLAAASFANQLNAAAKKLKATDIFNPNN